MKSLAAFCAAFALLLASNAWSQDAGFYIGASIGQSKAKDFCDDSGGFSCDDKDTTWKILAGYQFSRTSPWSSAIPTSEKSAPAASSPALA